MSNFREHGGLRRSDLERLLSRDPDERIPGRNATKADILVYRSKDGDIAVKTYAARPWWVRRWIAKRLIRREARAYRAAGAVPGLPRYLGTNGSTALATAWLEARPLSAVEPAAVGSGAFDELERIVRELHARGVALADLHRRDVLIGGDGSVHVVDLAASWLLGPRPGPLRRALFERLRLQDLVAIARMRARCSGEDEHAAIERVGRGAARRYRHARRLKSWWNRLRGR